MSEKLLEVSPTEMQTGLMPGVNPLKVPLWLDARGMVFDAHGVHSALGRQIISYISGYFDETAGDFDDATGLFDAKSTEQMLVASGLDSEVIGMGVNRLENGARNLFLGTLSKLFLFGPGGLSTIGSGFSANADQLPTIPATRWSMVSWQDDMYFTNGIDAPKHWDGSTLANIANAPFSQARLLRKIGPHLVAINTNNYKNGMEWCAEGAPDSWDPSTYPTAGNLPLLDLQDEVVNAEPLGQDLALYTGNEMQLASYLGGQFIIGSRPMQQGIGAVSGRSIVSANNLNFGILENGLFVTDGVSVRNISDPAMGKWISRNVNFDQASKISGYYARKAGEIRWAVPLIGANNISRVLTYNPKTNAFGFSDQVFNVAQEPGVWPYAIQAGEGPFVLASDVGTSENGAAVSRYVTTKPLDMGARTYYKYIDYLQVEIEVHSGSGPQLLIGTQENLEDTITWLPAVSLTTTQNIIEVRESAVFYTFKFQSESTTDAWTIGGFSAYGYLDGEAI